MATWLHKRGHRNCTGHLAACTWCSVQERYCAGRLAQARWRGVRGFHIIPSHPPPIRSFGDGALS